MIERIPQWAWEPTSKLRKSALIDLAKQSGGEWQAWDRFTVPELIAEITRRQLAAREAHWEATAAARAKDEATARSIGLAPARGTYRALKSARVMINADEANDFVRSLPPMPLAGEDEGAKNG